LLVGGYAVGYHGHVRGTADIDIWIDRRKSSARRAVQALKEFGFEADEESLSQPDRVIRLGVPPLRIEILTSVSGIEFEEAFAERIDAEIGGVAAHVIGLRMLRRNKGSTGRLKDEDDLRNLPER